MKCLLILVVLTAGAVSVHADVGVVVTGETSAALLTSQIEGWLHDRGRTVQPAGMSSDSVSSMNDCFILDDLACVRSVIEQQASATAVVFVHVDVFADENDGTRDLDVIGYWLEKGHQVVAERKSCGHCTDRLLRETTDDLMLALAAKPPISDRPSPATTEATPVQSQVPPHDSGIESDEHRSRALPIAILTVGGGAMVTGGALIAFGGPPKSTTQEFYRDLRTPGYFIGAGGVLVVGAGLYLLFRSSGSSAPTAIVTRGGAVIGWSEQF
jgi:hypothetical protein